MYISSSVYMYPAVGVALYRCMFTRYQKYWHKFNVQVNVSIANDSTAVSDETIIGVYHMDHSPNSADNDV